MNDERLVPMNLRQLFGVFALIGESGARNALINHTSPINQQPLSAGTDAPKIIFRYSPMGGMHEELWFGDRVGEQLIAGLETLPERHEMTERLLNLLKGWRREVQEAVAVMRAQKVATVGDLLKAVSAETKAGAEMLRLHFASIALASSTVLTDQVLQQHILDEFRKTAERETFPFALIALHMAEAATEYLKERYDERHV